MTTKKSRVDAAKKSVAGRSVAKPASKVVLKMVSKTTPKAPEAAGKSARTASKKPAVQPIKSLKQQCPSCHGTGLYSGIAEARGEAVVCLGCEGQGWVMHQYKEFVGRRKKSGIKKIYNSQDGMGSSMSYSEFERRHPVKEIKE